MYAQGGAEEVKKRFFTVWAWKPAKMSLQSFLPGISVCISVFVYIIHSTDALMILKCTLSWKMIGLEKLIDFFVIIFKIYINSSGTSTGLLQGYVV